MKITYVCNEYPPRPHGGIGTFYQRCSRAMVRAGHEVTVVGMGNETSVYHDHGVRVQTLRKYPLRALVQFGNRRRLYDWLGRRVARGETDIIQVPDFQGLLPYPLSGCPVVVRLHMTETIIAAQNGGRARFLFRRFERQTLSCHRNWIASSKNVLQKTLDTYGIHPGSVAVVFPPVTGNSPGQAPEWLPEKYVLFAGTVCRGKGAILVAEAATDFLDRHPDLHLIYAGPVVRDGSRQTDDIIRNVVGPDRLPRVHFTGRLPNDVILALMQRARTFVFPSGLEAFGQVVSEAMSMGCPTITFGVPPFTEFITHGEDGIFVPPNSPTELANAVSRVIREPEWGRRIGEAARRNILKLCSEEAFVQSTLDYYRELRALPR